MSIFVVGCLHGDEPFGEEVIKQVNKLGGDIQTVVAHPAALDKSVRFIESDMNRSFNTFGDTLESRLAEKIKHQIKKNEPRFVLDIHTSVTPVGKIAILARPDKELIQLSSKLGMDKVIVMPESIAKHSLIGAFPRSALSLEFGANSHSVEDKNELVRRIVNLESQEYTPIPVYVVEREITKHEHLNEKLLNFHYSPSLNGYPVLAAPDNYEDIGGFLARKLEL